MTKPSEHVQSQSGKKINAATSKSIVCNVGVVRVNRLKNNKKTKDDVMLLLMLRSFEALIISWFGQNVLLNECSISSTDEHNVPSSRPWKEATAWMTCCRSPNGPLVLQRLVALAIGVSRHFYPGHPPTRPMFSFFFFFFQLLFSYETGFDWSWGRLMNVCIQFHGNPSSSCQDVSTTWWCWRKNHQ